MYIGLSEKHSYQVITCNSGERGLLIELHSNLIMISLQKGTFFTLRHCDWEKDMDGRNETGNSLNKQHVLCSWSKVILHLPLSSAAEIVDLELRPSDFPRVTSDFLGLPGPSLGNVVSFPFFSITLFPFSFSFSFLSSFCFSFSFTFLSFSFSFSVSFCLFCFLAFLVYTFSTGLEDALGELSGVDSLAGVFVIEFFGGMSSASLFSFSL